MADNESQQPISASAWGLIFLAPALWSVNYVVARLAPAQIAPHALAATRWALAAVLLGVFAWSEIKAKRSHIWAERWQFLVLAALGMWVCGAWLYTAARSTSANNIALIYTLSPIFIVLGAALWLHEGLRKRQLLGIALAFAGLLHVIVHGDWPRLAALQFVQGDLIVLLCALSWGVYSLCLKHWRSAFSPMARLVLTAATGALIMLPLAVIEALPGHAWHNASQVDWKSAGLILAAAIFPGAGAYWTYAALQKRVGAARTSLVLYLGPLFAAALAWLVLGEPLQPYHAVGALVILPGVYLASLTKPHTR